MPFVREAGIDALATRVRIWLKMHQCKHFFIALCPSRQLAESVGERPMLPVGAAAAAEPSACRSGNPIVGHARVSSPA
jgi:hypothetical protein